jgi:hypothetical protein
VRTAERDAPTVPVAECSESANLNATHRDAGWAGSRLSTTAKPPSQHGVRAAPTMLARDGRRVIGAIPILEYRRVLGI